MARAILAPTPELRAKGISDMEGVKKDLNALIEKYQQLASSEKDLELLRGVMEARVAYNGELDRLVDMMNTAADVPALGAVVNAHLRTQQQRKKRAQRGSDARQRTRHFTLTGTSTASAMRLQASA